MDKREEIHVENMHFSVVSREPPERGGPEALREMKRRLYEAFKRFS